MDVKKKQIASAAVKLFAQQGYHATSMQEIAEHCGMSKGALYLQFQSKEELLLTILEFFQNDTLEKIALVAQDETLPPKERLIRQVYVLFYNSFHHADFIKTEIREQLNHKSRAVKKHMQATRQRMLNWKKEALLAAYGDTIKPYLWDLVFIFHAIMGEYRRLLVFEKKELDMKETATFVVERIDTLIKDVTRSQPQPIITTEMMAEMDSSKGEEKSRQNKNKNPQFERLVDQIRNSTLSEAELHSLKFLLEIKSWS